MNALLFTPGPLTTSATVKKAMQNDVGSRDKLFIDTVQEIRTDLLSLGHVSVEDGFECVLMQGAGTFAIESVLGSSVGQDDTLLILSNGAYGERQVEIAKVNGLKYNVLRFPENELVNPEVLKSFLSDHPFITHVSVVHCETTTGIFNPIQSIGEVVKKAGCVYIIDAMSSFGGVDINLKSVDCDFLISSSNKCIEGVPGFGFILSKRKELLTTNGRARSLSLDLYGQWAALEKNGQFRFTPPTLSLMAFRQALKELHQEGGIAARSRRYKNNMVLLTEGMQRLGFVCYLPSSLRGHIISSFLYPTHPAFDFTEMYDFLRESGFIIYPGKLSTSQAFRIGNIGHIFSEDIQHLLESIKKYLLKKGILSA